MKTILEYLIITFPLTWELVTDYIRIVVNKKEDNHVADIPVRVAMCAMVGFASHFLYDKAFVQGFIYSGSLFFLFDPILNLLMKRGLLYKGKNVTDQLWKDHVPPHGEIFYRIVFLIVGWMFYYQFDQIIGR